MIRRVAAAFEARPPGGHVVRVVESDEPSAVWRVQREGVGQAMWSFRRWRHTRDGELQPVTFLQMMNAPVERQQELESVIRRRATHITW